MPSAHASARRNLLSFIFPSQDVELLAYRGYPDGCGCNRTPIATGVLRITSSKWKGSRDISRPSGSTAAGLNAYIPILSVGLLSRWTDLIDLPAPWDALGDPIVLGIVGVVGVADFIGDKVPIVDHVLHAIGPGGRADRRRVVGARVGERVRSRSGAGGGHGDRRGARDAGGPHGRSAPLHGHDGRRGNPAVSLAEDGVSGVLSVTALFWPVVTAVLAVIVLVAVFLLWRRWRHLRARFRRRDVPVT